MRKIVIFSIMCLTFTSCGSASIEGEDHDNLMESSLGLQLTEGEHEHGWGRTECSMCHDLNNIHLGESESGYDLQAIRDIVLEDGISSCASCHGDNGVN